MEVRIVSFKEWESCPKKILSAEHWIPKHKIKECGGKIDEIIDAFADSLGGDEGQLIRANWKDCVDENRLRKELKEILGK